MDNILYENQKYVYLHRQREWGYACMHMRSTRRQGKKIVGCQLIDISLWRIKRLKMVDVLKIWFIRDPYDQDYRKNDCLLSLCEVTSHKICNYWLANEIKENRYIKLM